MLAKLVTYFTIKLTTIVAQDQMGGSVIVAVPRMIKGEMKIDPSYEVYAQQLELIKPQPGLIGEFEQLIQKIKAT